jgi:hypothetical protein
MAGLMQDAEMIAKSARRAHSRSSLFAVSALGALAAGVVLTVRDDSGPGSTSTAVTHATCALCRAELVCLWAEP